MPKLDPKQDAHAFSERLNRALAERNFPERGRGAELARRYRVSQPTAHAWLKGKHMPMPQVVKAMAAAYGVDYDWLYFGTGSPQFKATTDTSVEVPLWDAEISAGFGAENEGARVIGTLSFKQSSLGKRHIDHEQADALFVRGMSMMPRLKTGDVVLFDRRDTRPREGKMFVVHWNGHEFVKRLRHFNGRWHLCSDNQNDDEWKEPRPVYETDDFEIKGRVRWIGSWED